MVDQQFSLTLLPDRLAVCRLAPTDDLPAWALGGGLYSATWTASELSIVCLQSRVPAGVVSEGNWRCLRVAGPLDFSQTGVLASLAAPLAEAGIGIFVLSTHETDYLLVKAPDLDGALQALRLAGHEVG